MKRKIWVGVGAYALTSVSPAALPAAQDVNAALPLSAARLNTASPDRMGAFEHGGQALQLAAAGGEGGEGGEAGAMSGTDPDEAFVTRLLLMKGHLRVGKELVDQGAWDDALAHFKHPVEEIYDAVQDELSQRGAVQFKDNLEALAAQVKSKTGGNSLENGYAEVTSNIDEAIASVDAEARTAPDFVFDVALRLLKQAAEEYEAAVADGNIVNVAEYQDSRGFVWVAEDLVQSVSDKLRAKDDDAYEQLMDRFAQLKQAWPAAVPPMQVVASTSEVYGTVSRIELAMYDLR